MENLYENLVESFEYLLVEASNHESLPVPVKLGVVQSVIVLAGCTMCCISLCLQTVEEDKVYLTIAIDGCLRSVY